MKQAGFDEWWWIPSFRSNRDGGVCGKWERASPRRWAFEKADPVLPDLLISFFQLKLEI